MKKVYVEKVINFTIKKNTVRKFIKVICNNTAFVFDNEVYKQIDGVSMGLQLAPVLVNIITTELKKHHNKKVF